MRVTTKSIHVSRGVVHAIIPESEGVVLPIMRRGVVHAIMRQVLVHETIQT